MGRLLNAKRITLWAAVVILIIAGVLPLLFMLVTSFSDVDNYAGTLGNARTWSLFRNSLSLALLTTMAAGAGGVVLGILLAKTNLPWRAALTVVFSLPLLFPPYILAVGWFEVLGRGGLLARLAGPGAGEVTSRWLFGLPGVVLVMASALLPVVLLLTMNYIGAVSPALEEAARLSVGWPLVLQRITLPLAAPGIVLSLVLVFLLTMGEFGAPAFLRVDVFPVASFTQFTAFYNFGAATAAALPLVAVALAGLAVEQRVIQQRTFQFGWGGHRNPIRIPLGRARAPIAALVASLAALLVALPMGALMWRGLNVAAMTDAIHRAGASAGRSIAYAGVSATVLASLGFFLAYLVHRRALVCWRWVDAMTLFLLTLPGNVIGIGLIGLWNRPFTNWVYATPVMLVVGYVAQYSALGTRSILAGFAQTAPSLEEAAEVAGAGWCRRGCRILAPLVAPSIVVSWVVTFLFCLRDVSLPLLLAPPGQDTLTGRTMTLMANGSAELVAALCLLSISLTAVPLIVYGAARKIWSRPA
ncbi:MAG TPA: ABC transporter permease subunit [Paludibaculum sp.]|jgi:iron(III) transport system permease protein